MLSDTAQPSTVERLGVETVAAPPRRLHTVPTPTKIDSDSGTARLAAYQAIAHVIAASASVLATRLVLLLGLVGAFVLAVIAAEGRSWSAVAVLVAYAILVLIPLVWLEARTKWQ